MNIINRFKSMFAENSESASLEALKYFGALNDTEIKKLALEGMIVPFSDRKQSTDIQNGNIIISYGLSSHSYDLRLSPRDFRQFQAIPGEIIDPLFFDDKFLQKLNTRIHQGKLYFVVAGNSYSLGVSHEVVTLPSDIVALVFTKSTYARCGFITANTLIDAGFKGSITLEFSNASPSPLRVYANQGIVQLVFFRGEEAALNYAEMRGKYLNQKPHEITLAKTPELPVSTILTYDTLTGASSEDTQK